MPGITLTAGCKVNLYLEVLGRRPDGYHDLRTLFYPLPEPADRLEIKPLPKGGGLKLNCDVEELSGGSNSVVRAYHEFGEATGYRPDLAVRLFKSIPTGAGLGGGSSDAAAMLRFLNEQAGDKALSQGELVGLSARIGADVPFFLERGPAWAEGIGDRLAPADLDLRGFYLVLACPDVYISTAWAFKAWDAARESKGAFRSLTCAPERINSTSRHCLRLWNSFEDVVFPVHPELRRFKEELLRLGAAGVVLSGSGAGFCALFRGRAQAENAADALKELLVAAYVHAL
ncbi:MAG: 4-(cytidine 5'-diphospho)-2-C-methyl-D-erythritol kinase [Thermodesulfobacteriota bacterium]|nr:4-(cytidine 5'-diphospho)-2-C-methyl-D-erythritol kinase [Thermodesulfobacteriota bacterium]